MTSTEALIQSAVTQAKKEIREDIADGTLPANVATFVDLHDHVDANEYGGLCDPNSPHAALDLDNGWTEFQDAVDQWLVDGGHRKEVVA